MVQILFRVACACALAFPARGSGTVPAATTHVTVPMVVDHNRAFVDADIQRADGTWRTARLWIDTGNPAFFLGESLARDLGMDAPAPGDTAGLPGGVRIDGMLLDFDGVATSVLPSTHWLFTATHADANLPSTVLMKYQVVFDYPARKLTLAKPGALEPRGTRAPASIHPETGVPQIDAVIDGDTMSFALDNGASYSFVSASTIDALLQRHPEWPRVTGTSGCANMWGWWPPHEETARMVRVPEVEWGGVRLTGVGVVGVAGMSDEGPDLGAWYSQKTARPVAGLLGPNAFDAFRVEIDFANSAVYFEKDAGHDPHDMDLVPLALRPEADGTFRVIGVVVRDGSPLVAGVEAGDLLREVDGVETTGATLGAVVDALRGRPGDVRALELERDGRRFTVEARVQRVL